MPAFEYPCLVNVQRAGQEVPTYCIFHAKVGEVLQWAAIRRLEDTPGSPQRKESRAKVNAIKRFLALDARNTIPTAVILTLRLPAGSVKKIGSEDGGPDLQTSIARLVFAVPDGVAEKDKPGLVVDGQHRLLGIKAHDPNLHVNVIALLQASDMETAFQFMVINNKASKVPTDHIRALSLQYPKEELQTRLRTARLTLDPNLGNVNLLDKDDGSPFYRVVDWPTNPEEQRMVFASSLEAAIGYIQQKKVKQFESEDVLLEFVNSVWGAIKDRWPDLWKRGSRLVGKVGVICMTEYVTDALIASYDWGRLDIADPAAVRTMVNELLNHQEKRFWTSPWVAGSYDTRSGRTMVVEGLVQIARNIRADEPWYAGLTMIDIAALGTEQE